LLSLLCVILICSCYWNSCRFALFHPVSPSLSPTSTTSHYCRHRWGCWGRWHVLNQMWSDLWWRTFNPTTHVDGPLR